MTDSTPRASACPDCRSLIPATPDDRREHRAEHTQQRKVLEAVRQELKDMRKLVTEARAELATAVTDIRREVGEIDIPAPVEPMVLEEWPADEIDDDEPEDPADDEANYVDVDDEPITLPGHLTAAVVAETVYSPLHPAEIDPDDFEERIRRQTGGIA